MAIKCCNGCVPPRRTPGCHATCDDYIAEKATFEEQKAAADSKRKTRNDIYSQRAAGVNRAMKRHGRRMGGQHE